MNIWCYIIIAISILLVTLIIMIRKENFQCDRNHCNKKDDDNISIHALTNTDLPMHMF